MLEIAENQKLLTLEFFESVKDSPEFVVEQPEKELRRIMGMIYTCQQIFRKANCRIYSENNGIFLDYFDK